MRANYHFKKKFYFVCVSIPAIKQLVNGLNNQMMIIISL